MNTFGFIGLLKMIYGKKLPDLKKIESKGLLAVKIAQHFALRIDFLDPLVCNHLMKLYRNTGSIPEEDFEALLFSYVPRDWMDHFEFLDKKPFASASIGQVHKGRLKNGDEVVVKIIKKRFKKNFLKDIKRLMRFMKLIIFFYPKLSRVFDPIGILEYIREYMVKELNLVDEIEGGKILGDIVDRNKSSYDLKRLSFNRMYKELSNENVLVSRLIQGSTFDELLNDKALEYKDLLEFFHLHGFFLFNVGVFHGDIHPGNILRGHDGQIILVDTGAISEIGENIRKGLYHFFEALAMYDYENSAIGLNKMAKVQISGAKFEKFRVKFLELYKDFTDSSVSQISLTKKMMQTIKLGVNCGMEFEKGMFAIIKSMMYLDGMVLRCKPDAILMHDMRPFIDEFNQIA